MPNRSKELDDIEYWKKSGIVVTNNEIADQIDAYKIEKKDNVITTRCSMLLLL